MKDTHEAKKFIEDIKSLLYPIDGSKTRLLTLPFVEEIENGVTYTISETVGDDGKKLIVFTLTDVCTAADEHTNHLINTKTKGVNIVWYNPSTNVLDYVLPIQLHKHQLAINQVIMTAAKLALSKYKREHQR